MFNWIKKLIKMNTTLMLKPEWEVKPKRARSKGRYKADDKSTPNYNEAWVGGKAPKKKKKKAKKKKARKKKDTYGKWEGNL
jgi:hypothetical protein|tara:strand:+ start:245 stop:487 length:243 start_codon:yes stop_codon:yes gene_type:complete